MSVRKHVANNSLCTNHQNTNGVGSRNPNLMNPLSGYIASNGTFDPLSTLAPAIFNPIKSTCITPYFYLGSWNSEIPLPYPSSYVTFAPTICNYGAPDPGFAPPTYNLSPQPPSKTEKKLRKCRTVWNVPENQLPPLPLPGWKPFPLSENDNFCARYLQYDKCGTCGNVNHFVRVVAKPFQKIDAPFPCLFNEMAAPSVLHLSGDELDVQNLSPEKRELGWSPVLFVPVHYICIPRKLSNRPFIKKSEFYKLLQELGGDPGGEGVSSYFVPPATHPGDPYGGLERYWIQGFMWLFMEYYNVFGDIWTLEPTEHPPHNDPNTSPSTQWSSVIHTAKVRFNCQKSGHGWTSMQGRVIFWFRLQSNRTHGTSGQVLFKLYGQKCDKCSQGLYETPLWYPEEVFNALWHLHLKVGEYHYGRPPTAGPRGVRTGKPLRPHRPELCQACNEGICKSFNKEPSAQS